MRSTSTVTKAELTFSTLRNTGTKFELFFFFQIMLGSTKLRFFYIITPKMQSFKNAFYRITVSLFS